MTILSRESKEEFKKENYSARMAATARPVSPHVTIYAFPACALSSITTRVTGCALSFGSAGLGLVEIVGGNGAALDLMSTVGSANVAIVAGAKFAVAFPIVYHYLGGLRHIIWDNNPEMLSNVDVEKASYVLVGTSLLLSGVAVLV
jgi:succinate dehydrogenase (ubiquinone) cytochrome b560 subunit